VVDNRTFHLVAMDFIIVNTLKDILKTGGFVIYTMLIIATGFYIGRGYEVGKSVTSNQSPVTSIPTIEDIQQLVGCEKIDGKIGPETLDKWNRAVCDQYAEPYFKNQKVNGKNVEGTLCRKQ